MKKIKESLFFIVSLILLTGLSAFLFTREENTYLRDTFGNAAFWRFAWSGYAKAMAASFVPVLLLAFFRYALKGRFYHSFLFCSLWNVILSSVFAAVVLILDKIRIFGVPMAAYDPSSLVHPTVSVWQGITGLDIAVALQIGVFVSFVFWMLELLFSRKKKDDADKGPQLIDPASKPE